MKSVIIFITTLVFGYLLGSFIAVSFDISEWNEVLRFLIGVITSFLALGMASVASYD
jgi:hypothetical protein